MVLVRLKGRIHGHSGYVFLFFVFPRDKAYVQYGREKKGQEVRYCFILGNKKNLQVTNPVILKDTLEIKTKAAFLIHYFISLTKLCHLDEGSFIRYL